ncbi:MAG: hypothetical protein HY855_11695 [Burkholderiales bacterium]|nr:hypothetical protein [Burkholderiales bacterium]
MAVLAGCASAPGTSAPGAATTPAASPAPPQPGLDVRGDVIDPARVGPGSGQAVRGLGGWEGELVGKPPPGSKFTLLQVGMSVRQVLALIGPPLSRAAIPGPGGEPREVLIYPGQGRLVFVQGPAAEGGRLTWVIHRRDEGAAP